MSGYKQLSFFNITGDLQELCNMTKVQKLPTKLSLDSCITKSFSWITILELGSGHFPMQMQWDLEVKVEVVNADQIKTSCANCPYSASVAVMVCRSSFQWILSLANFQHLSS